jgi:hypothetical protein
MDSLFDKTLQQQRSLEAEMAKWKTYEESSDSLSRWLQDMEQQFKADIILKATLDEKKAQLQSYRTALQEIKSQVSYSQHFILFVIYCWTHRDKTRVLMHAKMFPHLKLYVTCLWAPLLVLTQSKETVSWSNLVFFTTKTRF